MKPSRSNGALLIVAATLVTLAVVLRNLVPPSLRVVWGRPFGSHYVRVDSLVFWWFLVAGLFVGLIGIFKASRR